MKKYAFILGLALLSLPSCAESGPIGSSIASSEPSSSIKTGDADYIILRSDLNRLKDFDSFSFSGSDASFATNYKSGTIYDGLGTKDPTWLYVASDSTVINVDIGSLSGAMAGLKSSSFAELGIASHMENAKISAEGITGSSLVLSDKVCGGEFYVKDGAIYAKPNGDLRTLLNVMIKEALLENGSDPSNFSIPEKGVKASLTEEAMDSIDSSGLLPFADKAPTITKALLDAALENGENVTQKSEMAAGKRVYYLNFAALNPHEWLIDALKGASDIDIALPSSLYDDSYGSLDISYDSLLDSLDDFLATVTSSYIALKVAYGDETISSIYLEGEVSFDETKMKAFILDQDPEAGSASIPLSFSFELPISFDWAEVTPSYPSDLASYEEVEIEAE